MGKYAIHPDLKNFEHFQMMLNPRLLPLMNGLMSLGLRARKPAPGLASRTVRIPGHQGGLIGLTIIEPKDIGAQAPCLLFLHGGAFVLQAAPHHLDLADAYALQTPCKVILVDYRLAPKHPFPVGLEDAWAALEWTFHNAGDLGIDPGRLAIGGDSAGGALAAALCQMARDRRGPSIRFQMLVYPVTDARQTSASMREFTDTPVWNAGLTRRMWELYLRDGDQGMRAWASPLEAASLAGLPDSYVEVAEFDCLRDEGIQYAEALGQAGCRVELNRTSGTVHGFEVAWKSRLTTDSITRRVAALRQAFGIG